MLNKLKIIIVLNFLFIGNISPVLYAKTYCVANCDQLSEALEEAGQNGEDDHIGIVAGTYSGNFALNSSEANNVELIGYNDSSCTQEASRPADIVLEAAVESSGSVFTINPYPGATYSFCHLSFKNGKPSENAGGGIFAAGNEKEK